MTTEPHDHQPESASPDDFWGTQNDWPATSGIERPTRRRLGSTIGNWWGSALGGDAKAGRSHGEERSHGSPHDRQPSAPDLGDDLGDSRLDDLDAAWDDETAAAPVRRSGVDPLLARFGVAAVIITLAVPAIMGATSDSSGDQVRSAETPTVMSTSVSTSPAIVPTSAPSEIAAPGPGGQPTSEAVAAPVTEPSSTPDTTAPVVATVESSPESTTAPAAELVEVDTEPAATVALCGAEYELSAGDYWIRIADAAGVSMAELLGANGATSDTMLTPGRSICLPAGASTPAPPPVPATTAAPANTQAAVASTRPTTPAATTQKTPATTAPPATTTPSATPPSSSVTAAQAEAIIRTVWPDELEDHAIEIAQRESKLRPNVNNYCCYGLFQIYWTVHRGWLEPLGITSAADLYDPVTNANAAYALYQRSGGFGPWGG